MFKKKYSKYLYVRLYTKPKHTAIVVYLLHTYIGQIYGKQCHVGPATMYLGKCAHNCSVCMSMVNKYCWFVHIL
jgi:hypothetical protein